MGQKYQISLFCLIILLLAVVLVPDYGRDFSRPVRITMDLAMISPETYKIFQRQAKRYMSNNPEVEIVCRNVPGNAAVKMMTQVVGRSAADIMCVHYTDFPDFAAKGAFYPLRKIKGFDQKVLDLFFPISVQTYSVKGEPYGVPFKGSAICIIYNKDFFRRAGIPFPSIEGWDWDEFSRALQAIARLKEQSSRTDITGLHQNTSISNWIPWFWNNGGPGWLDEKRLVCLLDHQKNIETFRFFMDLKYKYQIATVGQEGVQLSVTGSPFENGKVAMIVAGPWLLPQLKIAAANGLDWDITQMPHTPGQLGRTRYAGLGLTINARTAYPDVCWDILVHLTSAEAQRQQLAVGEDIPSRMDVAAEFVDPRTPWREEAFIEAVNRARPQEEFPHANAVVEIFRRNLEAMWNRESGVEEAAGRMTAEINSFFERTRLRERRRSTYPCLFEVE